MAIASSKIASQTTLNLLFCGFILSARASPTLLTLEHILPKPLTPSLKLFRIVRVFLIARAIPAVMAIAIMSPISNCLIYVNIFEVKSIIKPPTSDNIFLKNSPTPIPRSFKPASKPAMIKPPKAKKTFDGDSILNIPVNISIIDVPSVVIASNTHLAPAHKPLAKP